MRHLVGIAHVQNILNKIKNLNEVYIIQFNQELLSGNIVLT